MISICTWLTSQLIMLTRSHMGAHTHYEKKTTFDEMMNIKYFRLINSNDL